MKKILLTTALSVATGFFSFGQQDQHLNCGLPENLKKLYAENPNLEKDYEKLFMNGLHLKDSTSDDSTVFIIPIVFHILHEYGTENITDEQVINQVAILNRDYRLLNSDTSDVVQQFKQIYGDAKIEFRLATRDPFGNCTNGIDHIYTHLTNAADDYSKLNQWNRANYLNVWVTKTIGESGVAGYAYYPSATTGTGYFIDGVIILNDYIGSTGTGSSDHSRALTHEIGHYLTLSHPWGSTNDPEVACGDDGIEDTPITTGNKTCVLNKNSCTEVDEYYGIDQIDNVQNYMDYSYCSVMFTKAQISAMRAALQSDVAYRSNLTLDSTHTLTGIDLTTPPVCAPIADFNTTTRVVCAGTNVAFKDWSYNTTATSWQWIFEDGSPATSTSQNPTVTFTSGGYKDVTLIVGSATGYDTLTIENYMYVKNNWPDFVGPHSLTLEDPTKYWFGIINYENNYNKFDLSDGTGKDFSTSYKLTNYRNISGAASLTDLALYYKRLGYAADELITPSFDLSNTTSKTVSFDYSFSSNAQTTDDMTDKLYIFASENCGQTWTQLKVISNVQGSNQDLLTSGYADYTDYAPESNNEWNTFSFNYGSAASSGRTMFKLKFVASDYAGNLYIDNFNVGGTLGIVTNEAEMLELNVYPNPSKGEALNVTYTAQSEPVTFILRDIQGKEITSVVRTEQNQTVSFTLDTVEKLPAACYFLEVQTAGFSATKKVVVLD